MRLPLCALFLLASSILALAQPAPNAQPPIRFAGEALALPAASARGRPVALKGVVTAHEPDWDPKFFLQDESGGIFVVAGGNDRPPNPGDIVELTGVTGPGAFAPIVHATKWRITGHTALPPAKSIPIDRLMAGAADSQRVEISGQVRAAYIEPPGKMLLEVAMGAYRVRVFPKLGPDVNPQDLIGARVRAVGTAATSFNAALRQMTAVNLYVPLADDFTVLEAPDHRQFDRPITPIADLARYRAAADLSEQRHVKGILTLQRVGQNLYLQDATGALEIRSRLPLQLTLGQTVEAVGFLEVVDFRAVMTDATFRAAGPSVQPLEPSKVAFAELQSGRHPAELIALQGKLLDRIVRPQYSGSADREVTLELQSPDMVFTAQFEEQGGNADGLAEIPVGSVLRLAGVASTQTGDDGKVSSLRLLLPSASSVQVLSRPGWFTPERRLAALVVACVLLAAVAGWSMTVSKKNAMLKFLISQRESDQRQLREAHDQLERRVEERSRQLQAQESVRKAAEVEFRAVLTERTRLARELHDTLEQALTGIALQLETAAKIFDRQPEDARERLKLALDFVKQSHRDLRRSIWDLRSRELEQFDLAEALAISARQVSSHSGVRVEVETAGERRRMPEIVEENLLRIGQEALTNVVKHSGATLVTVRLEQEEDAVALEVRDNGRGLDGTRLQTKEGHGFGMLDMSERVKRLGGRFEVCGPAGEGTMVRVTVKLTAA